MGIIFLIIWLTLFLWRKNIRKEMLLISILFSIGGPLADTLYKKDWWNPINLLEIPVEAILVGFTLGGIAAVIYEVLFNKKLAKKGSKRNIPIIKTFLLLTVLFFGAFYIFKLNSLISTIIAFAIPTIIIYLRRKDLILNSLISGILLLVIAIVTYSLLELLTPGWVQSFWQFKNVPNIVILNVPLDDVLWYFLAGAFIGPLYEYWQEGKLINMKKQRLK